MKLIIPTIFAKNKKQFNEKFNKIVPLARNIQIDFMDGKFVPAKSIKLSQVPNLKNYKNNFEAHLMVSNPEKYLTKLKQKGFKKIIFHIESTKNPEKIIEKIKALGLRPMAAVNPETTIEKIPKNLAVLFMGVHPGKEKQSFIPSVYKKIESFRKKNPKIKIQVDGGVSDKNAKKLADIGVDALNSGSFISNSKNPKGAYKKLNTAFR